MAPGSLLCSRLADCSTAWNGEGLGAGSEGGGLLNRKIKERGQRPHRRGLLSRYGPFVIVPSSRLQAINGRGICVENLPASVQAGLSRSRASG